jgi:hypothetical protein
VTNSNYLDMFTNNTDVIEHIGGIIGEEPALLKTKLDKVGVTATTASDEQLANATNAVKQQYLVITYLAGSLRLIKIREATGRP